VPTHELRDQAVFEQVIRDDLLEQVSYHLFAASSFATLFVSHETDAAFPAHPFGHDLFQTIKSATTNE